MKSFDKLYRVLFIASLAGVVGAFGASDKMLRKASEAIKGNSYRSQVEALSSDEMQGREPGGEGELKTAEYIEKQYLELGLQPVAGGARWRRRPAPRYEPASGGGPTHRPCRSR